MRSYLVKVHCCGTRWIVHVPALDRWTLVTEKSSIKQIARQMISILAGAEPASFEVDLVEGRALSTVGEFAPDPGALRRWDPAPTRAPSR
ncbi:hypothetical protein [Nocardia bhagyanarayanae]|uniref:Uncharacterized protein n=1 Tax=Nocardia bhagyanarayanae TaxID=1215925 RepID=A0A543FIM3_9NOCA|nr:hypothetical protein [Nocardia bhagyanarayanae]TQM33718.1 hypothetical protein FB390_5456 [Nocardia bhagyanarayanae]